MTVAEGTAEIVNVHGLDIEIQIRGAGAPLLLLASEDQLEAGSAVVADLARDYKVIMPS